MDKIKSNKKSVKTTNNLLPPPVKPRKQLRKPQAVDEVDNRATSNKRTKIKVTAEGDDATVNATNVVKMTLMWNTSGWIRVYLGTDRSDISCEDPNKMLHVNTETQTVDIIKDMVLPDGYTLWVQIGGKTARRLRDDESPLLVQEEFLRALGFEEVSRRGRLAIDPEFKFIQRFFIGPSEVPKSGHATRSGSVEILKGHVFPQWMRRSVAIIGGRLIVYPADPALDADVYDLNKADVFEHTPNFNRLIIKIVPKMILKSGRAPQRMARSAGDLVVSKNFETIKHNGSYSNVNLCNSSNGAVEVNVYNSRDSVHSTSEKETAVIFFGFEDSWERDLWSLWLLEATTITSTNRRMDITNSGLTAIPDVVLQSADTVEELVADQNQLQNLGLRALSSFTNLKKLHLSKNGLKIFPDSIFKCKDLTSLDLSDNNINSLSQEISLLKRLQELCLDRNELASLPESLSECEQLTVLKLAHNRLEYLPTFMLNVTKRSQGLNQHPHKFKIDVGGRYGEEKRAPPLTNVNLRANHLKGNIILGNYSNLTELDLSENQIEVLDLTALDRLESLQCCRNRLIELTINGASLRSLIAGNNNLKKVSVVSVPQSLNHIDLSYNELEDLPNWIRGCEQLRTLFLSHNHIRELPDDFFNFSNHNLHTLQLSYNKLTTLPPMFNKHLALRELFLQSNDIIDLPEHFFSACNNLCLLNVSSNKLLTLPVLDREHLQLERLYATNNNLTDRVLDSVVYLTNLKVLHLAYNRISSLPETCVMHWPELEELVISGNKLQHLPENLTIMKHLRVLRAHSNQLQAIPSLNKINSLRVLDIAGNQIMFVNLVAITPKKLQFLDISCNMQLQIDAKQLQACRSQRNMNLVDVSGKNRSILPPQPDENGGRELEPPWTIGFSETPGNSSKLYVSQLRLPSFCNSEGLFGLFDGENSSTLLSTLVKTIPKILLEERTMKETAADYMKYTMLSAHRELKQMGQKQGVSATVCHISRSKLNTDTVTNYLPKQAGGRRYILRTANVGDAEAILVRRTGYIHLTKVSQNRKIGYSASYPVILPNPETSEVTLGESDEYLVVANKKLWEVMDPECVCAEVRKEVNMVLAAKRLQDIAQSYGAEENISVLVVKFNNLGTDIDLLMRELRQTIRKKPIGAGLTGFCKCGCCCETNNNCCHSSAIAMQQFVRQASSRSDDRSSPSGQSDNTTTEVLGNGQHFPKIRNGNFDTIGSRKSGNGYINAYLPNERRSLRGGVARAVRARIEEDIEKEREETDSAISEEQFKCWEYMLEQNTQLLFDKELSTISKSFSKNPANNLLQTQLKALSASTPHLTSTYDHMNMHHNPSTQLINPNPRALLKNNYNTSTAAAAAKAAAVASIGGNPFLSKFFGSARSFQSANPNLCRTVKYAAPLRPQAMPLGGTNAAYFSSIQRLMPYNLEYDMNMLQNHVVNLEDSLDATDPHHYWGVATTEL